MNTDKRDEHKWNKIDSEVKKRLLMDAFAGEGACGPDEKNC
jgi:hypothetical protein